MFKFNSLLKILILVFLILTIPNRSFSSSSPVFLADVCPETAPCNNTPVDLGTLYESDVVIVDFDAVWGPSVTLESDEIVWLGWYDDSEWRPWLATALPIEVNPDVDFSCVVYSHPPPGGCPSCDMGFTCTLVNQMGDPLVISELSSEALINFFVPVGASGSGVVAAFDEATAEVIGSFPETFLSPTSDTRVTITVPEPSIMLSLVFGIAILYLLNINRKSCTL